MDKLFGAFTVGFLGLLGLLLAVAVWFGLTALIALAVQYLFNYIAVNTNHAGSQISFWVAFAVVVLLRLVGSFFSGGSSKSEK